MNNDLSHIPASSGSCVTITMVWPNSSLSLKNSLCNSVFVTLSRFPDGSSATIRPAGLSMPWRWRPSAVLLLKVRTAYVWFSPKVPECQAVSTPLPWPLFLSFRQSRRYHHVFDGCKLRQEVVKLEHESDTPVPEFAYLFSAE